MVNRAELRRLAEAATPGPWRKRWYGSGGYEGREGVTVVTDTGSINCDEVAYLGRGDTDEDTTRRSRNGAFIAAASPDVVLGLLDQVDELTKQFDHATGMSKRLMDERDQLRAVLDAIANHNPAVTHGWAEEVREMARNALKAR